MLQVAGKRPKKKDTARELAVAAARLAHERNCEQIVVLNLREISPVTDYFVICTGTSDRQMRAVADEIAQYGKSIGQRVWHVAGTESGQWIVLDFVDVVVHLFDQVHREYYDLELIWGASPKVRWAPKRAATRQSDSDREG